MTGGGTDRRRWDGSQRERGRGEQWQDKPERERPVTSRRVGWRRGPWLNWRGGGDRLQTSMLGLWSRCAQAMNGEKKNKQKKTNNKWLRLMRQWQRACVGWSCTCRVLTVAMLMRPPPSRDPPPTQTCRNLRTATVNSAKDRKAISWNKSSNSEAVLTKCFFWGGSWRLQTGLG